MRILTIAILVVLIIMGLVVSCVKLLEINIDGVYALDEPFNGRDRLDINKGTYTYRKYLYSNLFEVAQTGKFLISEDDGHFKIISDFEYLNGDFIYINHSFVNLETSFRFYKQ